VVVTYDPKVSSRTPRLPGVSSVSQYQRRRCESRHRKTWRSFHSLSTWWTNPIAIDPSPTADATRLILPARTSPTAKTPGRLVSSRWGRRPSGQCAAAKSSGSRSGPVLTNPRSIVRRRPWTATRAICAGASFGNIFSAGKPWVSGMGLSWLGMARLEVVAEVGQPDRHAVKFRRDPCPRRSDQTINPKLSRNVKSARKLPRKRPRRASCNNRHSKFTPLRRSLPFGRDKRRRSDD